MKFSEELRLAVDEIWEGSFNHPFVTGIADGTLSLDSFKYYVQQDAYYLSHYASVMAIGATKATDLEVKNKFAKLVLQITEWELELHKSNLEKLGVTEEDRKNFKPAPAAYAYTSHMYRAAHLGHVGDVLAAILPCGWLYTEIGQRLKGSKPGVEVYEDWIRTYSGEGSEEGPGIQSQIDLLDEIAETVTEEDRQRMKEHFIISSQYEYLFWEMSYTFEQWPK